MINQRQITNPFKASEKVESLIIADAGEEVHVDVIPPKQEAYFISSKTVQPRTVNHSSTMVKEKNLIVKKY